MHPIIIRSASYQQSELEPLGSEVRTIQLCQNRSSSFVKAGTLGIVIGAICVLVGAILSYLETSPRPNSNNEYRVSMGLLAMGASVIAASGFLLCLSRLYRDPIAITFQTRPSDIAQQNENTTQVEALLEYLP